MTDEPSADPDRAVDTDGETRSKRAASEIAALVAEQVRGAIEGAERSAEDLRRQALDESSARRGAVQDRATQILARIDELEGRLTRALRELRGEAAHIAKAVDASRQQAGTDATVGEEPLTADQAGGPAGPEVDRPPQPADDRARYVERFAREGADPAEAPHAQDDYAEPVPHPAADRADDEAADPGFQEGESPAGPAAGADARAESGAEYPGHAGERRRRPGLFRHRRDE